MAVRLLLAFRLPLFFKNTFLLYLWITYCFHHPWFITDENHKITERHVRAVNYPMYSA